MPHPLSELLINHYSVTKEQIDEARQAKEAGGVGIGDFLVQKNIITESQLLEALSVQYDIPFRPELPLDNIATDFTQKVPIQFLKKYIMVPLRSYQNETSTSGTDGPLASLSPSGCTIAINNPVAFQPLDDLIKIIGSDDYQVVLSTKNAILSAINISYDLSRDSAEQLVQDMEEDTSVIISDITDTADLLDDTSDAPIIKLVNHVISQSVKAGASDIHVEPYQDSFRIRYRVDGILHDLLSPPKWIEPAVISRIKVMAKMNIAEKRLPQDGRFNVKIGEKEVDVRASTIPTTFGERVVLRLLSKSGSLELSEIGLLPERFLMLKNLVASAKDGIILVTGPTGSGKTTTLYAVLSSIITPGINIITIEDPVEYQVKGISQIQVNPKINLTFASGLRSIVRQDPDVILVGEIRDSETAEIAVQSALTGHLVFSTVHTNDSASTITRLVDMGVEPFLISSAVIAVIAQRLIRVLCTQCREAFTPDDVALKSVGITPDQVRNNTLYRAKGCDKCVEGYRGRMGLFEIMVMDDAMKSLILRTYDASRIKNEAMKRHMTTLRQDGIQKVIDGITTIEEVLRVTQS